MYTVKPHISDHPRRRRWCMVTYESGQAPQGRSGLLILSFASFRGFNPYTNRNMTQNEVRHFFQPASRLT